MFMYDTDRDLFSEQWTQGDLGSIRFWVNIFSTLSQWIVSIVGFGIVIFSICKNALAGLYAVGSKLWDRVDEAHRTAAFGGKEGGNRVMNLLGSIPLLILKALPNIKALTVFDDEQITPKAYFMKSLPILCVEIFVGTFIFFGYPSQFAEKVGDFGTGVIDVVFANVDPIEWINKLPGQVAVYPYTLKGSSADMDKNMLEITNKIVATYMSRHGDLTKSGATSSALAIESWVIENSQYLGGGMKKIGSTENEALYVIDDRERYKLSVTAQYYPDPTVAKQAADKACTGDANNLTYAYVMNVSTVCHYDVAGKEIDASDSILVICKYVEQNVSSASASGKSTTATLTVQSATWDGAKGLTLTFKTSNLNIAVNQDAYVGDVKGRVSSVESGYIKIEFDSNIAWNTTPVVNFSAVSSKWPVYTYSNGKSVRVKEIRYNSSVSAAAIYNGNKNGETWAPGGDIAAPTTESSDTESGGASGKPDLTKT